MSNLTEHPWIREGGDASDEPMDITVIGRMRHFTAMNKLKKIALKVTDICQVILSYLVSVHLCRYLIARHSTHFIRWLQKISQKKKSLV